MLNKCISAVFLICTLLLTLSLSTKAQDSTQIQTGIDILPAENTTSARVNVTYGLRVTLKTTISMGTGFTLYNDPLSLVPIFIDVKYDLTSAPSLFFLSLKAGYNISILTDLDIQVDEHDGGLMLNPAIGMTIPTELGFQLSIHAGYTIDKASFSRQSWDGNTIETDITYKRLMAGIGFIF